MSDKNQAESSKQKDQEENRKVVPIKKDPQSRVVIKPILLKIRPETKHDKSDIENRAKSVLEKARCKVVNIYNSQNS